MSVMPPKPWERSGAAAQLSATPLASQPASTLQTPTTNPAPTSPANGTPSVPQRPSSITAQTTASPTGALTTRPYTPMASSYASPYSTYGASSYMSPYNRFSNYGSYGSYGGYGGYGYGSPYGMSPYGMPGVDPATGQPSLIQQVESSTSQTFALIQSIVGTFTGFAQMLDSTFVATHSSFFAMLGVAEQFGQLKVALGQVLGLFGFVGWLRGWWRGDKASMKRDFKKFLRGEELGSQPSTPPPSKKPIFFFILAVFGLPYLMHRVIKHIASRLPPPVPLGPDGKPLTQQVIDPANLTFVRALYPFETRDPVELSLSKGELVAVLSMNDPVTGLEGDWWRGRTREGREGWFPKNFVEIIKTKKADLTPPGKTVS
ncbi:Peroxisomal membrane protein PAS20 [Tulasnella sp. 403]|nr:Peroxisomal membrane protein PAS20 [Tulasnella sp. 403]